MYEVFEKAAATAKEAQLLADSFFMPAKLASGTHLA